MSNLIKNFLSVQKKIDLDNGLKIYFETQTSDFMVFQEIFGNRCYENLGIKIERNDIILDAGAHVGTFSLYAIPKCKKVISIEPSNETFFKLKKNISLNNLQEKIIAINAGLGGESGEKVFYELSSNVTNTFEESFVHEKAIKTLTKIVGVNDLLEEYSFTMIKLDIEGMEHEVIGSIDFDNNLQLKKIVGEIHTVNDKKNFDTVKSFLESKGFDVKFYELCKHTLLFAKRA